MKPRSNPTIPRKKKLYKKKESIIIPSDLISGTILSIDPSVGHLGWAIHIVDNSSKKPSIDLTHYGTVWVKTSGIIGASETLDAIVEVIDQHKPDEIIMEDYSFIRGKTRGMYVVPGMIMLIKYMWYQKTGKPIFMVPAEEWKATIIGSSKADKDMIKSVLQRILHKSIVTNITKNYAEIRGKNKGDFGEQDCYDAIGQGLYMCNRMINNKKSSSLELY